MFMGYFPSSRFLVVGLFLLVCISLAGPIGCGKNAPLRPITEEIVAPPDAAQINNGAGANDPNLATVILSINGSRGNFFARSGTSLHIAWSSQHTKGCELFNNSQRIATGASADSARVTLTSNSKFEIRCSKSFDGKLVSDFSSLSVLTGLGDPTVTLLANGVPDFADGVIGAPANLTWNTSASATNCILWDDSTPERVDPISDYPKPSKPLFKTTLFTLTCSFSNGVLGTGSVEVIVPQIQNPGASPTPSATPSATPSPTPSATPAASPVAVNHTIFVSSRTYSGNLGGLTGADQKCQSLADNISTLTGKTWKAILSDTMVNAKDRVSITGPILDVKGNTVAQATGANSLFSGSMLRSVRYTERGNSSEALNPPTLIAGIVVIDPGDPAGYEDVWSASTNQGVYTSRESTVSNNACRNWTSSSNLRVMVGNSRRADGLLDDPTGGDSSCDEQKYILCISQ